MAIRERIFSHRICQKLFYERYKTGSKIKVTNSLKCSGSEHKKPDWQREKRYVFILFRQKEGSVHFFRRVKNVPTEWTLMRQHYWLMCWHTVFPFWNLNFIYSEKATKSCEIFTLLLSYAGKEKISQNFVAFSEYMNFKYKNMVH